jgi:hypothetical protein
LKKQTTIEKRPDLKIMNVLTFLMVLLQNMISPNFFKECNERFSENSKPLCFKGFKGFSVSVG